MQIIVKNISKKFKKVTVLNNVNMTFESGKIYGLVGRNGSGKKKKKKILCSFYKPNTGEILFKGHGDQVTELTTKPVHEIIKLGLVRTFQNVELIRELSIIDNVLIGGHIDFKASTFSQALRLPKARKEEKQYREEAEKILENLGILDRKDMLVGGQPYGILKKVEMARTLMARPKLIILDEPAAGLNDSETLELAKLIKKIRDEFNCAILLVEHDMRLVMDICDRICAINFGKLLTIGTPKEIQQNHAVQSAYLGVE